MPDAPDDLPACTDCAKCCHYVVALGPRDEVPEEFVVEHDGVRCMDQHGDGACVALDPITHLCTIYERRPQVCRDLQRGGSLCRRAVLGRRGSLAEVPCASLCRPSDDSGFVARLGGWAAHPPSTRGPTARTPARESLPEHPPL